MISFKEITRENIVSIILLSVFEEQKDQVEPNGDTIAYGLFYPEHCWFRAIYKDNQPVGFFCLYLKEEERKYHIWRFMIDKNHQRKGYGKTSIDMIKKLIKDMFPDATDIKLSYAPKGKKGADHFYRKLGFIDTGEMWGEGKVMSFTY